MTAVRVGEAELHVREWGDPGAPAVLLWHALGPFQSGAYAAEVAGGLADLYGLRVVAPDGPGFGASPALSADAYRPSVLADLARGLLDVLGLARIDWVGASWGGTVGCYFAERHRDRLGRLVLLDVGYQGPLECLSQADWIEARRPLDDLGWPGFDAFVAAAEKRVGPLRPAMVDAMRAALRHRPDGSLGPIVGAEVAGAVLWGVSQEPPRPGQLGGVPVLLVSSGDADETEVERFRATVPGSEIRRIHGAGHDLVGEAGPGLVPLVGDWLSQK